MAVGRTSVASRSLLFFLVLVPGGVGAALTPVEAASVQGGFHETRNAHFFSWGWLAALDWETFLHERDVSFAVEAEEAWAEERGLSGEAVLGGVSIPVAGAAFARVCGVGTRGVEAGGASAMFHGECCSIQSSC